MALGADSRQIGRRVLASAAVRAVSGIALGLIAAAVGMRWIRNLLFEVNPLDPGSYAVVVAVVCLVVLGGSAFPARRAAAIDPLTLLKRD
jgi:ABC-type antimicrobial peptide transport system permease subunit